MAMAVTPAPDGYAGVHAGSGYMEVFVDIAITGSYTTNGDALDLTTIAKRGGGRGSIMMVLLEELAGYGFRYDRTNKKVIVHSAAGTELTAAAYPAALLGNSVRGVIKTQ
jgi:hypothetical protein